MNLYSVSCKTEPHLHLQGKTPVVNNLICWNVGSGSLHYSQLMRFMLLAIGLESLHRDSNVEYAVND
jgi:hypothetical protein